MLVSVGEVAAIFGVSASTVRRWEREGKLIPHSRTLGGHRRYSLPNALSEQQGQPVKRKKTILYSRVSGHDQKSDLERQGQLLMNRATEEGWVFELISDLGSGLRYTKPGIRRLLRMLLSGEVERIVLTHRDRLLRFGSELIFQVCAHYGVEVVILEDELQTTFEERLVAEVIEILTVHCARLHGRRSHRHRGKAA